MSAVIDNITSLNLLLSGDGPSKKRSARGEIKLQFVELTPNENKQWEDRINQYYFSCGCPQGAASIMFTMVCYVFYIFLRSSGFHITWLDGVKALGLFIISGAIGKIIGLKLGKKQLRKTIFKLESILQRCAEKNKTRLPEKTALI